MGYQFGLYIVGEWEEIPSPNPHYSPQDAAEDYALRVAQNISASRLLTEAAAVEVRINTALGLPNELKDVSVRLLWARVNISADPLQETALTEQLQREHEAALQEKEDHRRLQRARDLRNALLTDPSIALAHWFMDRPEAIDEQVIKRVDRLIEEMTAYAPDTIWVKVARILQDFVGKLPEDARLHLVETLAGIFDRYGYPGHAKQLRAEAFDIDGNGASAEPDHD